MQLGFNLRCFAFLYFIFYMLFCVYCHTAVHIEHKFILLILAPVSRLRWMREFSASEIWFCTHSESMTPCFKMWILRAVSWCHCQWNDALMEYQSIQHRDKYAWKHEAKNCRVLSILLLNICAYVDLCTCKELNKWQKYFWEQLWLFFNYWCLANDDLPNVRCLASANFHSAVENKYVSKARYSPIIIFCISFGWFRSVCVPFVIIQNGRQETFQIQLDRLHFSRGRLIPILLVIYPSSEMAWCFRSSFHHSWF